MSYATEERITDGTSSNTAEAGSYNLKIGQPVSYRLARAGARPLRFSGSELAMAMSFTPELPYWYEINLYRTSDMEFVVAIRLFHQAEEINDTVQSWKCGSMEEALSVIEGYDAGQDVTFGFDVGSLDCPASELAARAIELQARLKLARRHYQGLVGEILSELDAA